ncbi:hypothetical protein B566_EDAN000805, partial [Ephemera danica]
DFTCPTCNSGFIEEIEPLQEDDNDVDSGDESLGPGNQDFFSLMMGELVGEPPHRHSEEGGGRFPAMRRSQRHLQHMPLENLIQDFIVNITGMDWAQLGGAEGGRRVAPVSFFLGNPGDYAWGREGLDAIVTQLLNQMDGTGPPPLAKDKIQGIPTVQIAKEQVDQSLQCSVCWEDFTLGENVRKLPCEHFYHDNCIIPWLELHGTCPICRKVLHEEGGDDQSRANNVAAATNSLPQSLAALFRAASGANSSNREGSQTSQESGSSASSSSTVGSSSSSTSTRPNTRSQQRNQAPRDRHNYWDMDIEYD